MTKSPLVMTLLTTRLPLLPTSRAEPVMTPSLSPASLPPASTVVLLMSPQQMLLTASLFLVLPLQALFRAMQVLTPSILPPLLTPPLFWVVPVVTQWSWLVALPLATSPATRVLTPLRSPRLLRVQPAFMAAALLTQLVTLPTATPLLSLSPVPSCKATPVLTP